VTNSIAPPRLPTHRHVLIDVGLVITQVSAFLSGLVIWFFAGFDFENGPGRPDYLHMALGFGLTAALLALSVALALVVRARIWVPAIGAVLVAGSAVFAVLALIEARQLPPAPFEAEPWWWPLQLFFCLPTSWPLIVACLGTVMVGSAGTRD
jgi:hypothetical protein